MNVLSLNKSHCFYWSNFLQSSKEFDFLPFILRLFFFYSKSTVKTTINGLSMCVSSHNNQKRFLLFIYRLKFSQYMLISLGAFLLNWIVLMCMWTYKAWMVNVNSSAFTSRKAFVGWMETPKLGRTDQKCIVFKFLLLCISLNLAKNRFIHAACLHFMSTFSIWKTSTTFLACSHFCC